MKPLSIHQIAEIVQGTIYGNPKVVVSNIITDSRLVTHSNGTLFFALKTAKNDGHKYIQSLIKKGVRLFVVQDVPQYKEANFIKVEDSLKALQVLAHFIRQQLKGEVIAITGSNGKTVVKEWLFQLLSTTYTVYRSPRSYNSQLGVALSLIQADVNADYTIIEAGISEPGEMLSLQEMIEPDTVLLTNIGDPHQENFKSFEQKTKEKLILFEGAGRKVVCFDDKYVKSVLNNKFDGFSSWSLAGGGTYCFEQTKQAGSTIIQCSSDSDTFEFSIPFMDKASIQNAMTCFATILTLGLDPNNYLNAFSKLESVAMRMELKQGVNGSILINDVYNSDIGSLSIALDFLLQQGVGEERVKRVIISDIEQSGEAPEQLYRRVNQLLLDKGVDCIIGIGFDIKQQAKSFKIKGDFYSSTKEFLDHIHHYNFEKEAILVKGARQFEFEQISDHLALKVHKTTLEINLNQITQNIAVFRSHLKAGTKIMAMVKAFAYGSGSYEIARHLQYHGIDYLAVAVADEGVELRKAGVTVPIVVMGPEMQSLDTLLEYHLEPEIYGFEILKAFAIQAKLRGVKNYPIHLKLDTGMHRMGFIPVDMDDLIEQLKTYPQLKVASIFSHLAAADEADKDIFTLGQIHLFERMSKSITESCSYPVIRHILNSAGAERFIEHQYDMVRLGIGMYGVSAIGNTELKPVSTFKTTIVQIKDIPQTETVGYGRKGVLSQDSTVAVIPVGYADGLSRMLGNGRGYAMVQGQQAPYVGNICMDLAMLDITNLKARIGDEVIIFGETPHISLLAQWMQTIPYEVITGISHRVKRVFIKE